MIKISSQTLTKIAFWNAMGVSEKDADSIGGYEKQYINSILGSLPGAVAAGIGGGMLGFNGLSNKSGLAGLGLMLAGIPLSIAGHRKAIQKSEEAQGFVPSTSEEIRDRQKKRYLVNDYILERMLMPPQRRESV